MKDMLWDEILEGPDFTAIRDLIESFCDVIEDHTDDEGNILFEVEVFNMPSSVKGRSSIPTYMVKEGHSGI